MDEKKIELNLDFEPVEKPETRGYYSNKVVNIFKKKVDNDGDGIAENKKTIGAVDEVLLNKKTDGFEEGVLADGQDFLIDKISQIQERSRFDRKMIKKVEQGLVDGIEDLKSRIGLLDQMVGSIENKFNCLGEKNETGDIKGWLEMKVGMDKRLQLVEDKLKRVRKEEKECSEYYLSFLRVFSKLKERYSILIQRSALSEAGSQWLAEGDFFADDEFSECLAFGEDRAMEIMSLAKSKACLDNFFSDNKNDISRLTIDSEEMIRLVKKHSQKLVNLKNDDLESVSSFLLKKEIEDEILKLSKINWIKARLRLSDDDSVNVVFDKHLRDKIDQINQYKKAGDQLKKYFGNDCQRQSLTLGWQFKEYSKWDNFWRRWRSKGEKKIETYWLGVVDFCRRTGKKDEFLKIMNEKNLTIHKNEVVRIRLDQLIDLFNQLLDKSRWDFEKKLNSSGFGISLEYERMRQQFWQEIIDELSKKGGQLWIDRYMTVEKDA